MKMPLDGDAQARENENYTPAEIQEVIYGLVIAYTPNSQSCEPSCLKFSLQQIDNAISQIRVRNIHQSGFTTRDNHDGKCVRVATGIQKQNKSTLRRRQANSVTQHCRLNLVLRFAVLFMAVALAAITLHELAHLVAAGILGIDIVSIRWFDPAHIALVIQISPNTNSSLLLPFWYAGGLTAGIVLLSPLVVRRGWFTQSLKRWTLGLCLATLAFIQLSQGILEGAFHDFYISDAGNIIDAGSLLQTSCGLLGLLSYLVLFPLSTEQGTLRGHPQP